jgi:type IV pilus assembly protein PilY1
MNATNCTNGTATGTATTATRSMGRGVFILNAADGSILWRAGPEATASKQVTGMTYSMSGDLAVFRNRANTASRATIAGTENVITGHPDRIYAADTGGNVWRIDVTDDGTLGTIGGVACDPCFPVNKLASVAVAPVSGSHAALNYRKFLFSPDVVYSSDTLGDYDAVLLGSGDREHAFDQIVNNRFYMFKDRNTGTLTAESVTAIVDTSSSTDLFDVTNNCLGAVANCSSGQTQAQATTDLRDAKGWRLVLSTTGEKTIATATTAAGTVIFNTNEPKQDAVSGTLSQCVSELGTARQYGISYKDATASLIFNTLPTQYVPAGGRYAMFAGGGFLPTPVPVVVQIGGTYYQTVIAGVQTTNPGGLKLQSRIRTYWYRKTD